MKFQFLFTQAVVLTFVLSQNLYSGEILRFKNSSIQSNQTVGATAENISRVFSNAAVATESAFFAVQFTDKVSSVQQAELEALGLKVFGYVPDDAYIVQGSEDSLKALLASVPGIHAIVHYDAELKLETVLLKALSNVSSQSEKAELFSVRVFDEKEVGSIAANINLVPSAKVMGSDGRFMVVSATRGNLMAVAAVEGIESIDFQPLIYTLAYDMGAAVEGDVHAEKVTGPVSGWETGTRVMNMEAAWNRGFNGKGQIVAVADTGLDSGSKSSLAPDLGSQVVNGYPMTTTIKLGPFEVPLGTTWNDTMGHGTHVSGSVASSGSESDGQIKGGAFGAKIIMEGMWSSILKNLAVQTNFEKLMGTPYKEGARIHTNSWGSAQNPGAYDQMAASADEVMWNHPDLLVLFAAGNSGADANKDGHVDQNSVGSPGTAKNVLTVGASENNTTDGGIQSTMREREDAKEKAAKEKGETYTRVWSHVPFADDKVSDHADGIAFFSSRGPTVDGRTKPEIVAPGTNILSTKTQDPAADPVSSKLWGDYAGSGKYAWCGGTSMATPLTAGAAAVVRQFLVEKRGIANPSGALVKAALMHTATDLFPGQYGTGTFQELTKRPNINEGYGLVNMDLATGMGAETQVFDHTTGVGANSEVVLGTVVSRQGGGIRVTMVYTDAPAVTTAKKTLVNDLDLSVQGPSGNYGIGDRTNNHEMLELSNLDAGTYTIKVKGYNVPSGKDGKQPFAVFVTAL